MTDLEAQAEKYMRSVMNGNTSDVFTRADLYEYIIEAYKQGQIDAMSDVYKMQIGHIHAFNNVMSPIQQTNPLPSNTQFNY